MDNRFGDMETFLEVTRTGSFATAAKALRLTPSAVSRSVARLEARLGILLIQRTTRSLTLTPEGESYRDRISSLLAEVDEVELDLGRRRKGPRGPLRINASVPFGTHCLLPILPGFVAAFPDVTVDLSLSDAVVDLIEERADIAIRVGPLRDSQLRARKLGQSPMAVVASPHYLARYGAPAKPADLGQHHCLRFSFRRAVDSWPFRVNGRVTQRQIDGPFLGNSGEVVRLMALAGGGIARLGVFHIMPDLAAGHLVEVLGSFNPGDVEEIHAIYAGQERLALRVGAFLEHLDGHLKLPSY